MENKMWILRSKYGRMHGTEKAAVHKHSGFIFSFILDKPYKRLKRYFYRNVIFPHSDMITARQRQSVFQTWYLYLKFKEFIRRKGFFIYHSALRLSKTSSCTSRLLIKVFHWCYMIFPNIYYALIYKYVIFIFLLYNIHDLYNEA